MLIASVQIVCFKTITCHNLHFHFSISCHWDTVQLFFHHNIYSEATKISFSGGPSSLLLRTPPLCLLTGAHIMRHAARQKQRKYNKKSVSHHPRVIIIIIIIMMMNLLSKCDPNQTNIGPHLARRVEADIDTEAAG
jgi:hypothetical protein